MSRGIDAVTARYVLEFIKSYGGGAFVPSAATITAGVGLTGGGLLTSSPTIDLDTSTLTADTAISGTDTIPFHDGAMKYITFSDFVGDIDHDALLNFVANEHIDHSTVDITAGVGLTGGGDITTTRTIDLDISTLTADTDIGATDLIAIHDGAMKYITRQNFEADLSVSRTNFDTNLSAQIGFFNGSFLETFDALVSSDGATITLSLEQSGGGDLTMAFSDGYTTLDCTPAQTISLTAGTDTVPQENYLYVLQSTKALTKSTSGWPSAEHIKVAYVLVRSAASEATNGPLINQNWNDHAAGTDGQGHMTHMAERSRRLGAIYRSGIDETLTIGAGSPDPIDLALTSGTIYQMHTQTFPAFDTAVGDVVYVVNYNGTPYFQTSDIETGILADSTGATLANKYFNIVVWAAANKGGENFSPVFINLPNGSYNNLSDAENDVNGYDVFTIPEEFRFESSTGILLYRYTFRYTAGTSDISLESTVDLRGLNQFTASGGTAGTTQNEYSDAVFRIFDDGDNSKEIAFQLSGLTTATTRTLTVADTDINLWASSAWGENFNLNSYSIVDTSGTNTVELSFVSTDGFQVKQSSSPTVYIYGEGVGAGAYVGFASQDAVSAETYTGQIRVVPTSTTAGAVTAPLEFGFVYSGTFLTNRFTMERDATHTIFEMYDGTYKALMKLKASDGDLLFDATSSASSNVEFRCANGGAINFQPAGTATTLSQFYTSVNDGVWGIYSTSSGALWEIRAEEATADLEFNDLNSSGNIVLTHSSSTTIANLIFRGEDAGGTDIDYANVKAIIDSNTIGATSGHIEFGFYYLGGLTENRFTMERVGEGTQLEIYDGTRTAILSLLTGGDLVLQPHTSSDIRLRLESATNLPRLEWWGENSIASETDYAAIYATIDDSTFGTEDATLTFAVTEGATITDQVELDRVHWGPVSGQTLNSGSSADPWNTVYTDFLSVYDSITYDTAAGNVDASVAAARVFTIGGTASNHQVMAFSQYASLQWYTSTDVSLASSKHPITIGPFTTGAAQLAFDANEIMCRKIQYYGTISVSFVPGTPDTITRASGSFVTDGFTAPSMLSVEGSTSNDTDTGFIVTAVAATTLTLNTNSSLTSEGPVSCRLVLGTTGTVLYYNDYGGEQVFHDFGLEAGAIMRFTHYGGTPGSGTGNHALQAISVENAGFSGADDAIHWQAKPNGGSYQHGLGYNFDNERWYLDTGDFRFRGGGVQFEDSSTLLSAYETNSASALVNVAQFTINQWDDTAGSEDIDFALKTISGGTFATRWYQQGRIQYHDHAQGGVPGSLSYIRFRGRDSVAAAENFSSLYGYARVATAGAEYGSVVFEHVKNGVMSSVIEIGARSAAAIGIMPTATASYDLGAVHTGDNLYWQNLYVGEILLDGSGAITNEAGIRSNTSGDLIYRSHATGSEHLWEVGNAEFSAMRLSEASGQTTLAIISDDGAADNIILEFAADNSVATETAFGRFIVNPTDATSTSEDAQFEFWLVEGGSMTSQVVMSSTVFRPVTSLSHVLGGTSNLWNGVYADYYYTDSGAVAGEISRKKVTYHTHEMRERWATSGANEFWSFLPYILGTPDYAKEFAFDFTKNQPTAGTAGVWIFDQAPVVDYTNLYEVWHEGLTTLPGAHTTNGVWTFGADADPGADNSYDLGNDSFQWRNVYVGTSLRFDQGGGNGIRFWNGSSSYTIYMAQESDVTYGGSLDGTSDYNMYFTMAAGTNRGFVFADGLANPVAQIDAAGKIYSDSGGLELFTQSGAIEWSTDRSGMSLRGHATRGLEVIDTTQGIFSVTSNVATGTVNDDPKINFISNSGTGTSRTMAVFYTNITDVTNAAEKANAEIYTIASGTLVSRFKFNTGSSDESQFIIRSDNTVSPQLYFQAEDSGGATTNYARFSNVVASATAGAEQGALVIDLADGVDGSLDQSYKFNFASFTPVVSGKDLGATAASNRWEDAYFNGDVFIESAANKVASEYFTHISAEESAAPSTATSSGWQFSFGNGATTSAGGPIVMVPTGYTCHAVAMSLKVGGFGTQVDVDLGVNGTALGVNYRVSLTAATSGTNEFATPYSLSDGDRLNFQTTTATGSPTGPCYASVLLRYTKT